MNQVAKANPQVLAVVPEGEKTGPAPRPARFRLRHFLVAFSFLLIVVAPAVLAIGYLYTKAADQYHSIVSFSVHSEETPSMDSIFGAFTQSTPNAAADTDILFDFIRSQQIVEDLRTTTDLVTIFNRPEEDPFFTLGEDPSVEELHSYWEWMVSIAYDRGTGIIEAEVRAFTPEDAQAIGAAIVERSGELINTLSQETRLDTIRFAEADLREAENRLKDIRLKLQEFRNQEQIVDPTAALEQRMGLQNALEQQLATQLIERDLLVGVAQPGDSRLVQLDRRIEALYARIDLERAKLGSGGSGAGSEEQSRMAETFGRYEELLADREFAEQAYSAVLASYEQARADARRKHRYLLNHVGPTRAEEALYPSRWMLSTMIIVALVSIWLIVVMIGFNMKDRR
ncbi:MAG: sugar transporter [Pseudomonadota bacterium]